MDGYNLGRLPAPLALPIPLKVAQLIIFSTVRMTVCEKATDYVAFERVPKEARGEPLRMLVYCVTRNDRHMVVWPNRRAQRTIGNEWPVCPRRRPRKANPTLTKTPVPFIRLEAAKILEVIHPLHSGVAYVHTPVEV